MIWELYLFGLVFLILINGHSPSVLLDFSDMHEVRKHLGVDFCVFLVCYFLPMLVHGLS